MRLKDGAQSGGRDAIVLNLAIGRRNTRAHFRQVRAHVHADRVGLAARRVVQKKLAEAVVDDAAWPRARRTNIRAVILSPLPLQICRRVEAKQRYRPIAVGKKIDLLVDPDRIEII